MYRSTSICIQATIVSYMDDAAPECQLVKAEPQSMIEQAFV